MQPPNLNEISEKRTVFWYSKTGTSLCTSQPWQGCTLPTELRPRFERNSIPQVADVQGDYLFSLGSPEEKYGRKVNQPFSI